MKICVIVLATLLLASNAYWLANRVDAGISVTYCYSESERRLSALTKAMELLPQVAADDLDVAPIIKSLDKDAFSKEGYLWSGNLGFQLSESGELIAVRYGW
jgi:hypothetical protein